MPRTSRTTVHIGDRTVTLSNLDKALWPEEGITKAELIDYYNWVAPLILPHLDHRLLTLVRYPNGIAGESFYQKNLPNHSPEWLARHTVPSVEGRPTTYLVAREPAALVWTANHGAIELNPSHARVDRLDRPDWAIVDLDPDPPATYDDVLEVAAALRRVLDGLGMRSYPKTSGATGIHVYIPIPRRYSYAQTSQGIGHIGGVLRKLLPHLVTTERLVKNRSGKVYVDHLQNLASKTIVAVYSLRPRPGAPVSTPLSWDELFSHRPEEFTIRTVRERLARVGDLFRSVLDKEQDTKAVADFFRRLAKS